MTTLQDLYVELLQMDQRETEAAVLQSIQKLEQEIKQRTEALEKYQNLKEKYKTILTEHLKDPKGDPIQLDYTLEDDFLGPFQKMEE
jgi:DNA-binding protein H-NS